MEIYKLYSFHFDEKLYQSEFKKALDNAGIKSLSEFDALLKKRRVKSYDYETIKSYFYGRRVPLFNVFLAVCKELHLYADSIAFPKSIRAFKYKGDILQCDDFFRDIFLPYDIMEDTPNLTEFFYEDTYKKSVDYLALILSEYNYLIQKFHYAAISNDELAQISAFTERYIINKNSNEPTEWEKVKNWILSCKETEFLKAFYDEYTLGYYSYNCCNLLDILSKAISDEYISYAKQLLPTQEKFTEV